MSTTTHPRADPMSRLYRTRWFMPAFSLFLGRADARRVLDRRQPRPGRCLAAGVMAFVAALFYFGAPPLGDARRPRRPGRDERWERIDVHATALAGIVLVLVIIGAWLVEVAQGQDGSPYAQLGAVGGARLHRSRSRSCAGAPSRRSTLPRRSGTGLVAHPVFKTGRPS